MAPDFETHETGTREALNEKDLQIEHLKGLVRLGRRVVEDFLPNVGNCALQRYDELNAFMIASDEYVEKDNGK